MRRWLGSLCLLVIVCLESSGFLQADVYPDPGGTGRDGLNDGLFLVVREDTDPVLSQARIDAVRSQEVDLREWLATNSGGAADLYYDQILDVPLTMVDGHRPPGWSGLAKDYVRANYGIEPHDYYALAFDVGYTPWDDGQGWAGVCCPGGSNGSGYYLQYQSLGTHVHEFGHRIGSPHARTYLRPAGSYVWDETLQSYRTYGGDSSADFTPLTFGAEADEYGSVFDTMGSGPDTGHLAVKKKRDFAWIDSETQVPLLNDSGPGTYRIYAHNELEAVSYNDGTLDHYGVVDTYAADKLYGLRLTRTGEVFNTSTGQFDSEEQTIEVEYRSGHDGLLFFLNGYQLDVNRDSGDTNQDLELQQRLLESEVGSSRFIGEDFLSYNPPPPTDPAVYRNSWFEFSVFALGSDAIGSYIDVIVRERDDLNGIEGDVNQDGQVNQDDVLDFVEGWLLDTSALVSVEKYKHGDLDRNGRTNLDDAYSLHEALIANGAGEFDFSLLFATPEPNTLLLLAISAIGLIPVRRKTVR